MAQKNINLNDSNIKKSILKYLLLNISVSNTIPVPITSDDHLDVLKDNNKYFISPKYSGTESWFIFTKFNEVYYAVSIPKVKTSQSNIILYPIGVDAHIKIYEGTIFDGIYQKKNQSVRVIIENVYLLCGIDMSRIVRQERMEKIKSVLNTQFKWNINYQIYGVKVYSVNKEHLNELQKLTTTDDVIAWVFYPLIGIKNIFIYKITENDLTNDDTLISKVVMIKTSASDIYTIESESGEDLGIAYVHTLNNSKEYKKWFLQHNATKLLVRAKFNYNINKWEPFKIINKIN
jgi:hypothetical protein